MFLTVKFDNRKIYSNIKNNEAKFEFLSKNMVCNAFVKRRHQIRPPKFIIVLELEYSN